MAATRRSVRLRAVTDGDGTPRQDDCLSPLHMLGDAAASESMDVVGHALSQGVGPHALPREGAKGSHAQAGRGAACRNGSAPACTLMQV
jgi:hypothetical protein